MQTTSVVVPSHEKETVVRPDSDLLPPLYPGAYAPLFLFFHIAAVGRFRQVIEEMMAVFRTCGWYLGWFEKVYYGITGGTMTTSEDLEWVHHTISQGLCIRARGDRPIPLVKCLYETTSMVAEQSRETIMLHHLYEQCRLDHHRPFHVLYLHSKGVTRTGEVYDNVRQWRDRMLFFLLQYCPFCISKLEDGVPTVGVNARSVPNFHYAGNFWWASSSYIRTLTPPRDWQTTYDDSYLAPEMWIGSGQSSCLYALDNPKENFADYHISFQAEDYVHCFFPFESICTLPDGFDSLQKVYRITTRYRYQTSTTPVPDLVGVHVEWNDITSEWKALCRSSLPLERIYYCSPLEEEEQETPHHPFPCFLLFLFPCRLFCVSSGCRWFLPSSLSSSSSAGEKGGYR